jgi:SAM-dependent methyltransferase
MAEWFGSFFSGLWLDVQRAAFGGTDTDARAAAIERVLALRPGSRVLDVPCGNGRMTIPLARRGHTLTGVDFTPPFIAEARAAAGDLPITFLERDMRELADLASTGAGAGFDAALNWWGSFGYFDDAGDEAFAAGVCKALVPGGRFLIDINLLETLMPIHQPKGWARSGDVLVLEDRVFDFETSRMEVDWTFIRGAVEERKHASLRLYSAHEMVELLRRAGFAAVRLLDFTPLSPSSRRAMVLATK